MAVTRKTVFENKNETGDVQQDAEIRHHKSCCCHRNCAVNVLYFIEIYIFLISVSQ
jgi:hypothetical protein